MKVKIKYMNFMGIMTVFILVIVGLQTAKDNNEILQEINETVPLIVSILNITDKNNEKLQEIQSTLKPDTVYIDRYYDINNSVTWTMPDKWKNKPITCLNNSSTFPIRIVWEGSK
jgi:hypothetical protein